MRNRVFDFVVFGLLAILLLLFSATDHSSKEEASDMTPIESTYVQVLGRRVHLLQTNKPTASLPDWKAVTVVFLHGQVWRDIGTLDEMDKRGVRAIAVDLPGHGVTGGQPLPMEQRGEFVKELLRQLGVKPPVILVSPSMSGTYALPYIAAHIDDLAAWIPIAPVGLQAWSESGTLPSEEARKKLKVVAMYGEHDAMRSDYAIIEDLFPTTAQFVLIRDAGHACYFNQPKVWHRELGRFLDNEISL